MGQGEAWIFLEGQWIRNPEQDYQFLVRQNRFKDFWESLKVQNRNNPKYNGIAGAADQQHFFRILYEKDTDDDRLKVLLSSTYGNGTGWSTSDFTTTVLEFLAQGVSEFAPYNTFRITQNYDYTKGKLTETVELFKKNSNGIEDPYAKIEERARIFRPQ